MPQEGLRRLKDHRTVLQKSAEGIVGVNTKGLNVCKQSKDSTI